MRAMKRFLLPSLFAAVLVTAFAADAPLNQLTDAEKAAAGNFSSTAKTRANGGADTRKDKLPDGWKVEDGALVRHGGGDIVTKDQYENFELSIEWKISEGGNSGIMFKVQETDGPPYVTGPEAQLQDNVKGHDPQKAGWLYQFYKSETDATKPVGEWNQFRSFAITTSASTG
jgi:hypothetical protein